MNGTVNYYKTPDEIQEENHQLIIERLTTINALNEKRIDELSKTVHNLEEIIILLKKGGGNHE